MFLQPVEEGDYSGYDCSMVPTIKYGRVRVMFRCVFFLLAAAAVSGCYVLKQGTILSHYQSQAQDIDKVLAREDLSFETRAFLEEVLAVKTFAVEQLGLSDNNNYARYVETDREYLVDVVTACEELSFSPKTWKFPIVGKVPYKGFYQRKDAERLALRLQKEGYDVWVREVDAFSTLGYFTDPVYSFMKQYPVYQLADLIIHEQTHATIFIKDHMQFNEELATFVGSEGALAYIEHTRGDTEVVETELSVYRQDREQFYSMMRQLYTSLDAVYTSGLERSEKLRGKNRIISSFQQDVRENYNEYFTTDVYRYIADISLNNAHIISWNIYTRDLSLYYDVYRSLGSSLRRFIDKMGKLDQYEGDPKDYLHSLLD